METVQKSLFPHRDECLPLPLTEPKNQRVKILELVQIEKHFPVSIKQQWLGQAIKERKALASAFIAKAVLRYQLTRSLRNELLNTPNLHMICGQRTSRIGADRCHASQVPTAITMREKPAKKVQAVKTPKEGAPHQRRRGQRRRRDWMRNSDLEQS